MSAAQPAESSADQINTSDQDLVARVLVESVKSVGAGAHSSLIISLRI
jgi:hypothetical protein